MKLKRPKPYRLVLLLLIGYLSFISRTTLSQTRSNYIEIQGTLQDSTSGYPVAHGVLISFKTLDKFAADSLGRFHTFVPNGDSIMAISLGYERTIFHPSEDSSEHLIVKMPPLSYELPTVEILPFKTYEGFKRYIANLDLDKQPKINMAGIPQNRSTQITPGLRPNSFYKKPGIIEFIKTPLSFAEYHLSKKEKSKRKVLALQEQEKMESIYSNLISKENMAYLTGFKDSTLDDFILYCNVNIKNKSASELYLLTQIHSLKDRFLSDKHLEISQSAFLADSTKTNLGNNQE